MIFANGCEFCDVIPRKNVLTIASKFVARCRGLVLARIFQSGTFELVQALLLMCHYLQGTLELNECWNLMGLMLRTAVGIGLHLNPSNDTTTVVEREFRKRVWWGCVAIDRTLSMKFGRPPSIRATDVFEVDLPLNVDDQYITNDTIAPRQPEGRPSLTDFFIQTIKMSPIIDSVLRDLYQPGPSSGSENPEGRLSPKVSNQSRILGCTLHLDGKLLCWWDEIPKHLKHEPDVADGPDFQRQRNVMFIRCVASANNRRSALVANEL
jgi:hypothetical protein